VPLDREIVGKVVLSGGQWWYRKPNDSVRYGPFGGPSEAAEAARKAGVRVDDNDNFLEATGMIDKIDAVASRLDSVVSRFDGHMRARSDDMIASAGPRTDASKNDVYEIRFEAKGGKIKIPAESDAAMEAAAKKAGLWKGGKDEEFPAFTLYRNGEEIGGG
jgi:hypothetical protein